MLNLKRFALSMCLTLCCSVAAMRNEAIGTGEGRSGAAPPQPSLAAGCGGGGMAGKLGAPSTGLDVTLPEDFMAPLGASTSTPKFFPGCDHAARPATEVAGSRSGRPPPRPYARPGWMWSCAAPR